MTGKDTAGRSHWASSSTLWPNSDTSHFCPQLTGQDYRTAQPNSKEAGKCDERMEYLVSMLSLLQACISPESTHQPGLAHFQVDIGQRKLHMWKLYHLQVLSQYSWPSSNVSLNCVGPLIRRFFSTNTVRTLDSHLQIQPTMDWKVFLSSQLCFPNWIFNCFWLGFIESVNAKSWL